MGSFTVNLVLVEELRRLCLALLEIALLDILGLYTDGHGVGHQISLQRKLYARLASACVCGSSMKSSDVSS